MPKTQTLPELFELKKRVAANFLVEHWTELGIITACTEKTDRHPRLLRSMRFGDDDYPGCVLDVLRSISKDDPENMEIIRHYVDERFPLDSEYISAEPSERRITFAPNVFKIPAASL